MRTSPPKRPPKPPSLLQGGEQPLYSTTLPSNVNNVKPKGILKKKSSAPLIRSNSEELRLMEERVIRPFERDERVRHFDIQIQEPVHFDNTDRNSYLSFARNSSKKGKKSKNFEEPTRTRKQTLSPNPKSKRKSSKRDSKTSKSRPEVLKLPPDKYPKVLEAAKIESVAAMMHLVVIVSSIITITSMAILTNDWEIKLRRCPMYVEVSQSNTIYWGNENMAACHFVAYMPALTLVMSFALMLFHGGIIISWRKGNEGYRLLLSKTYTKIIFSIELIEVAVAISVASVLIDGVRQTCLGFQLSPWTEEIPDNCKQGYDDRDHVYGISDTYPKLIVSIVSSSISAGFTIAITILYFIRIKPCC
ncbi:UNVERIFIED_CONTAM: hypothetical protein RMT77_017617 [Armadillidium vulgare]